MQWMGASRSAPLQLVSPWRLAPTADARRSATQAMHNYLVSFTLIALLSAGCAHQKEQASAPARSGDTAIGTPRVLAPPTVLTNQLLTTFGEHLVGGTWEVRVPEQERTLEVGSHWKWQLSDEAHTAGFNSKPSGWRAQAGWFVLVENDLRVWAYDGDRDLLLYEFTRTPTGGAGCWSGPTKFGCAVPEAVLTRLSDAARKAIKPND